MGKLIFTIIVFLSIINAKEYNSVYESTAESKNLACQKALNNAKVNALSQAGTLIISNFSKTDSVIGKKYKSIKQKDLKSISVGVVKLISKKETIEITKDYNFRCKVNAVFDIDEKEVKKAIDKYLTSSNKKQNKNFIYIKATGYSEEGQSRYRAIKSAIIDAKRNLLDEIKGSKLISVVESKNGKSVDDKAINSVKGSIRFVKILSVKYDDKTRSATAIVGMTKEHLIENIKRWKKLN
jgi:hypothetical protein